MTQRILNAAIVRGLGAGLDFTNGKYRIYAIDHRQLGPTAGAWRLPAGTNPTSTFVSQNSGGTTWPWGIEADTAWDWNVTTFAAHGLLVGDRVAFLGFTYNTPAWASSTTFKMGEYYAKNSSDPLKNRVIVPGGSGGTQPNWPTINGVVTTSNNAVLISDGSWWNSPMENIHTISEVPTTTTLKIRSNVSQAGTIWNGTGYVIKVNVTFLSEFAPVGARIAVSNALSSRVVNNDGSIDCSDIGINVGTTGVSGTDDIKILVLVKTAAAFADADLPDTQQRVIGYYDIGGQGTMQYFIRGGAGPGLITPSNAVGKLAQF